MAASEHDYDPRSFWEERLSEHFDLRGTGHPGLPAGYNEACYRLRGLVLDQELAHHRVPVAGHDVLDAGCGSGFFVEHFLARGANVSGVDLTDVAVARLSQRFPQAHFEVGDLSTWRPSRTYDLVSCFDVFLHIVDEDKWNAALTNLADAVKPGGWFVFTDFMPKRLPARLAAHNVARPWPVYETALHARGMRVHDVRPTHHLLNSDLGLFRFLNRAPGLLFAVDRALLTARLLDSGGTNRLVLAQKPRPGEPGPRKR